MLLGAFRLQKADGKPGFYELFAIEEVDDTLQFVVKHFNPDWVGWEEKDKALRIRLTRISADEIVFGGIVFQRAARGHPGGEDRHPREERRTAPRNAHLQAQAVVGAAIAGRGNGTSRTH